ncbi:MAG TPA: hypothetical protein VM260_04320 [Pirellula sp.]|nr:hypothetical protein [Pirellula sp.]
MVKAFALLGCVAAVFLFQGCGGKKAETPPAVAATPDMAGMPSGGGGTSMPGGPGDGASAMAGGSGSNDLASMSAGPGSEGSMPGSGYGGAGMPGDGYSAGGMPGDAMPTPGSGGNFPPPGYDPNGMPGQSNRPRKPLPPPTIKEQAVMAFQAGNAKRAYTLLQAHALQLSDEEAAEILKDYRWASHTKRPQLGVNIAVGVTIKNPMKFTDLAPIGSNDKNQGGGGGGDSGFGATGMAGEGADSTKPKSLIESTGVLSSRLAQAFKVSHEKGVWSPAFKDHWLSTGRKNAFGEQTGNGMGGGGIGGFNSGGAGFGGNDASGGFSSAGEGGMPAMPAGGGMPGMSDPQFGGPAGSSFALTNKLNLPVGSSPIAPSLTFIGEDDLTKLMKKAVKDGYDALMIFEVTIGANQAIQMVTNDTVIRVVQPNIVAKDVKRVFLSNTLNNLKVARSKMRGEPDGVDEELEKVIKGTEKGIGLQDIPATLTPQLISGRRLPALIKETERSVVDRLSEVNFYYYKGYLDENQKADGFEQIAGESGRVIAIGSPSEKLAAIEKLLEREFK